MRERGAHIDRAVPYECPRSEGRVPANRVRTVKVAALSDRERRFGKPGASLSSVK